MTRAAVTPRKTPVYVQQGLGGFQSWAGGTKQMSGEPSGAQTPGRPPCSLVAILTPVFYM